MKDFLYNKTTKKIFSGGDLITGISDEQHKELLIMCAPGSFKEFPATCVGAASYLEAEDPAAFLREVRTQYTADGMRVNEIRFEGNKLKVNASY
jgi:hypothetical protein